MINETKKCELCNENEIKQIYSPYSKPGETNLIQICDKCTSYLDKSRCTDIGLYYAYLEEYPSEFETVSKTKTK